MSKGRERNLNYRIGLDIGIGSVGWAVLQNDNTGEMPIKILDLGVRTFDINEVPKGGESTAKGRREKRGLHRRTRRKALRMETLRKLIARTFDIDLEQELKDLQNEDVYELRARSLDEKLSYGKVAKILLSIAKRRGFQSNKRSVDSGSEEGKLLKAINENADRLNKSGFRTIGEMIYNDSNYFDLCTRSNGETYRKYKVRNHSGDYGNCFLRVQLLEEVETILDAQKLLGNDKITEEFKKKFVAILKRQRNFDDGPGLASFNTPSPYSAEFKIGECTFESGEKRAPKASFTFEYFTALSKINSLKFGEEILDLESKKRLYDLLLKQKEITFAQARKLLNASGDYDRTFNLCRYGVSKTKTSISKETLERLSQEEIISTSEKAILVSMKNSWDIAKALGCELSANNKDVINDVGYILTVAKSDSRREELMKNYPMLMGLSDLQKDNILKLSFDKVGSLSIKAMDNIIPHLLNGERYDNACVSAGYNHSVKTCEKHKYLKGAWLDEQLENITSNVAKRSINQSLRILNSIIKKYGSPQYVTVELARELAKSQSERKKIEKQQLDNLKKNVEAKENIKNEFKDLYLEPTYRDVLKERLYEEQCCKCMYSGKPIDKYRMLIDPTYTQIDHILPYSRSFDDSYNNKVLVLSDENQNKGNRTPFEFMGSDADRWAQYEARVNATIRNISKKRNLLRKNFDEDASKEYSERSLNDTKYISKFMYNLIKDNLEMKPSEKYKDNVRCVNGTVTAYLRKCWGINKIREDGDVHHAIDACVIATVTPAQIKRASPYNKYKELYFQKDGEDGVKYINKITGECVSAEEKNKYINSGLEVDVLKKHMPSPYEDFVEELMLRSRIKYDTLNFAPVEKVELSQIGYTEEEIENLKPVFISRMKNTKFTGAIHKDTIMSGREWERTGNLIKSVCVGDLKIAQKPEKVTLKGDKYPDKSIDGYYKPETDRLLYLKLKNMLVENGPITGEVYKPKSDGTDGAIVRKVKVYEKNTAPIKLPNGYAGNDSMHRVDVFRGVEDGKYYLCPIYMADVYAKRLPNKLININKPWIDIDPQKHEFLFSLYQNDLIKITNNKDFVLKKDSKHNSSDSQKPDEISAKEFLVYYQSTGISNASICVKTHDRCYSIPSLGVKTLLNIEKYYVDILGNIYKAPKEERKGF